MQNKGAGSSFVKRHIAAAIALPLFISYVYYLPPSPWFLVLLIAGGMAAMRELFSMYRVPSFLNTAGTLLGGMLIYIFCMHPAYSLHALFSAVLLLMLARMFIGESPAHTMSEAGPVGMGFLYIAVCMSFQWSLRNMHEVNGLAYIFALYLSVWLADSMAFYIGTYVGKNKLCPSISPKKTVEGAFGSLLGGVLGVLIAKSVFDINELSSLHAVIAGIAMGITALTGDLFESMFKRDAGIKDSGTFMPGHGGVFDRIDGMLPAGPVLYFIVRYF